MAHSSKILANLAWHLGAEKVLLAPFAVALLIASIAIQPLDGVFSPTAIWIGMVVGIIALGYVLSQFWAPVAGKQILRIIERDYGPKTSNAVFTVFEEVADGKMRGIDIPELAKSLGEYKRAK
jgi:hypothetical protein